MRQGSLLALVLLGGLLLISFGPSPQRARAIDSTVTVTITAQVPGPPTPTPSPTPVSGGGGGGGGRVGPGKVSGTVTFTGRAYPFSKVTILRDGQAILSTTAGLDARFQVTAQSLSAGTYLFAVYAEDEQHLRSPLLSFPVTIASNATILVSGVFLAPTIATDKIQVRRGEPLTVLGKSTPTSTVTIVVHSAVEQVLQTVTDAEGSYAVSFDTTGFDFGEHTANSHASFDNAVTPQSRTAGFAIGTSTITASLPVVVDKGDLNDDNKVNLIDFSVLAFWYKRSGPPRTVDLNSDGVVNLIDFSILAFYWTG